MIAALKRLAPWIVALIALGAAVTFFALWQKERGDDREVADMRSQATRFVEALTNFSADTIEADAQRIKSFAVGDFADEADAFFGERAIEALKEAEATSEGDVQSVFVQSLEGDTGSVFAVVNETVSNSQRTQAQTDIIRLEIGMIKTSSGWKVNRVDVLQSPGAPLPAPTGG